LELSAFADKIRQDANTIMIAYMVETSLLMLSLTTCAYLVSLGVSFIKSLVLITTESVPKVRMAAVATAILALPVKVGFLDNSFNSSVIEEYSYSSPT